MADLTKPHDVKAAFYRGVDVVFHYAAVTTNLKDGLEKPQMFVTDNVIMNSLLMREAHETGTQHFIFPSCTVMYKDIGKPVTEKELISFCKETLAGFKVPKQVVFCELPKTSTGKIQKFELRKKF